MHNHENRNTHTVESTTTTANKIPQSKYKITPD